MTTVSAKGKDATMSAEQTSTAAPSLGEAFRVWLRIGLLSFGGPAGQIAMMHKTVVEERRWIDEARFLHALNYCMLLPGPEAQQLATYIGWLMHRTLGGLIAGLLFILPGAVVMLGLSMAYVLYADVPLVDAAFLGVKAAVLIVVLEAVIRIGKRALRSPPMVAIAAAAFLAIFGFAIPFPMIVAGAALIGFLGGVLRPDLSTAEQKPTRWRRKSLPFWDARIRVRERGERLGARAPQIAGVYQGALARKGQS